MIRRGFTLIELIIAMMLTSLLGIMTYALFGMSADNLSEVDSLENTASKGRFAIEKMRTLFQVAGSYSSPDSISDPFIQPRPASPAMHVAGFHSYPNWQDQAFPGGYSDISFDGIILTGAFDFPTSFDAGGMISPNAPMFLPGSFSGMEKLNRVDPFSDIQPRDGDTYFPDLTLTAWDLPESYSFLEPNLASRLIRVTDGLGYSQFLRPDVAANHTFDTVIDITSTLKGVELPLDQDVPFRPVFKGDNTASVDGVEMREIGLDQVGVGEGDRTYEASFIDTYWLHVIPANDPQDPTNHLLVLDRVCAGSVATSNPDGQPSVPSLPEDDGCGDNSRKLIADKVVDFQVWFDCADAAGDVASNPNWTQNWLTPNGTAAGGNCLDAGSYNPGQARVAHVRLTLRTDEERKAFSNVPFANGNDLCTSSSACPAAPLRSFDINQNLEGAAPVMTFQLDVALRNFIIKDLQ